MRRATLQTGPRLPLAPAHAGPTLPPMTAVRSLLLLCLLLANALVAADTAVVPAPDRAGPEAGKRIAYLKIDGVIDPGKAAYYRRALDPAIAAQASGRAGPGPGKAIASPKTAGVIDPGKAASSRRPLDQAIAAKVDAVVV